MEIVEFAHVERLHAALRRLAPQIRAALVPADQGVRHLDVGHGTHGPWRVAWDRSRYRVTTGPHAGYLLGTDAEDAAACVAELLGVPLDVLPARRAWPSAPGAGLTI